MFVLLAIALGLSWLLCVAVLQVPGVAVHLFLALAAAAVAAHFGYRRILLRRQFASRRGQTGGRGAPPLRLRNDGKGREYIVS